MNTKTVRVSCTFHNRKLILTLTKFFFTFNFIIWQGRRNDFWVGGGGGAQSAFSWVFAGRKPSFRRIFQKWGAEAPSPPPPTSAAYVTWWHFLTFSKETISISAVRLFMKTKGSVLLLYEKCLPDNKRFCPSMPKQLNPFARGLPKDWKILYTPLHLEIDTFTYPTSLLLGFHIENRVVLSVTQPVCDSWIVRIVT